MRLFSSIIICLTSLKEVWSFSDCPGVRACQSRLAFHGYGPQTTQCPYNLIVEHRLIHRTTIINITINGTIPFRGFMIQAKNPGHPSPLGKFHNSVGGVNFDCGLNLENAIGHYEPSEKNETTVQWEPERMRLNYVEFYATIVYNFSTFWHDLITHKVFIIENAAYGNIDNQNQRRNYTFYRRPVQQKIRYYD